MRVTVGWNTLTRGRLCRLPINRNSDAKRHVTQARIVTPSSSRPANTPPCYPVTAHPPKLTRTASASATAEHQRMGFGGSSGLSIQKPPCLVCPAYHLQAEEQMAKGTEQETETEVSPAPIACHRWDDKSLGKFWQAGLWEISNTAC